MKQYIERGDSFFGTALVALKKSDHHIYLLSDTRREKNENTTYSSIMKGAFEAR